MLVESTVSEYMQEWALFAKTFAGDDLTEAKWKNCIAFWPNDSTASRSLTCRKIQVQRCFYQHSFTVVKWEAIKISIHKKAVKYYIGELAAIKKNKVGLYVLRWENGHIFNC